GARLKNFGDADLLELLDVLVRNDAADQNQNIVEPFLLHEFHDARAECHMRARENRDSDDVCILLERRIDDLFWSLTESRIDDFETRVTESTRDDFCAAVVPVQAGFGDNDADLIVHQKLGSSYVP